MNNFKKIIAGLCAISCLGVLTACGNKTEEVLALIDKGEFSDALDLYEEEIEDSSKEREQRKEIKKGLEKRYDKILDMYANDEIKDKELEDFFELIDELKIDTDDDGYDKFYSAYLGLEYEKEYYKNGLDYLEDEYYSDAIYYFELIDEESPLYEDAQAKLAEAQEKIVEEKLSEVQEYIDNENYSSAIDTLEYYEDELKGNEEYEKMLATAEEGAIAEVKATVDEYFADYDYYNAYYYLSDQIYYYSDIDEIQTMYDNVAEDYAAYMLAVAKEKSDAEDFESAANILEIAMDELGDDNADINDAYLEYKSYLPTYINTLDYFASNGSLYNSDTDNTGTEHQYSLYMDGWGEDNYWVEYLINGNYNVFEGVCGVSYYERSTTDSKYFEIYGDGKLLYTSPTMTQSVQPVEFAINVTDVEVLKISYPATSGSNSIATLYDGLLSRSDEVIETPTEAATEASTEAATEEGATEAEVEESTEAATEEETAE